MCFIEHSSAIFWIYSMYVYKFHYFYRLFYISYSIHNYSTLPISIHYLAPPIDLLSPPVLSPVPPVSLVHAAILINHASKSIFFISLVRPLIAFASWPNELSFSVHLVIQPSTLVLSSIIILHRSFPIFSIVFEISHILIPVGPSKLPFPIFFIISILTFKNCSVRPRFFTVAVSLVVFPFPFKNCFSSWNIFSKPMSLVVFPISYIDVSVRMKQSSFSLSSTEIKLTWISTFIREIKFPISMLLPLAPLSEIKAIFVKLKGR